MEDKHTGLKPARMANGRMNVNKLKHQLGWKSSNADGGYIKETIETKKSVIDSLLK